MNPEDIFRNAAADLAAQIRSGSRARQEIYDELMVQAREQPEFVRLLLPELARLMNAPSQAVEGFVQGSVTSSTPVVGFGDIETPREEDDPNTSPGVSVGSQVGLEEWQREQIAQKFMRDQLVASGFPSWYVNNYVSGRMDWETIEDRIQIDLNPPKYQKPGMSGAFGAVPRDILKSTDSGTELVGLQARTKGAKKEFKDGSWRKSEFGRKITPELKDDLRVVLIAAIRQNYEREIGTDRRVNTGVLLKAIDQGDVEIDDVLSFQYMIADLPGEERPWEQELEWEKKYGRRKSVHEYAPLVFQGRPSIQSVKPMTFKARNGEMVTTKGVGASEPKPILYLTREQLEKVDEVIKSGITPEVREWLDEIG